MISQVSGEDNLWGMFPFIADGEANGAGCLAGQGHLIGKALDVHDAESRQQTDA